MRGKSLIAMLTVTALLCCTIPVEAKNAFNTSAIMDQNTASTNFITSKLPGSDIEVMLDQDFEYFDLETGINADASNLDMDKSEFVFLRASEPEAIDWATIGSSEARNTKAALPDLVINNLASSVSEPFPINVDIPFTVKIYNIGSADANNVYLTPIRDGVESPPYSIGSIPSGTGINLRFSYRSTATGRHTIKLEVNKNRAIAESSYTNNTVSGTYEWSNQGTPDLVAKSIQSESGEKTLECDQEGGIPFIYVVGNAGTAEAKNIEMRFVFNNQVVATSTIPSLLPRQGMQGRIRLNIYRAMPSVTFGFQADPNNKIADPDRSDNAISEIFKITYDRDFSAEAWADASNLVCKINESALELMSYSDMANAVHAWNGLNSRVNITCTSSGDSVGNINISAVDKLPRAVISPANTIFNGKVAYIYL